MKNYSKPELKIEDIVISDIILESGVGDINGSKHADETIVFPGTHKVN